MTQKRAKRPKLDRDRPVRTFSTLFGPAKNRSERRSTNDSTPEASTSAEPAPNPSPVAPQLSDTVELGYRIIDEYLKQGQQVAQAFNPTAWGGKGPTGSVDDIQQMGQRVMQYGWDFAGMWFEMWSRMAGNAGAWMPIPGMPRPPGAEAKPGPAEGPPPAAKNGSSPGSAGANGEGERIVVSVVSERPTSTAVELRPGPQSELVVHSLRAEGHDGPAIRDVRVERQAADGSVVVKVTVLASQAPGTYNGLIIDAKTNLPRGTLSVRVDGKPK
jgi:hypothetical protein